MKPWCTVRVGLPFLVLSGTLAMAMAGPEPPVAGEVQASTRTVTCSSELGERRHCPADTSAGVALLKSAGTAACLLGKTWGYDDQGIWVQDGCVGEFLAGAVAEGAQQPPAKQKTPEYVPNAGFLLYEGENGQIYMRFFAYVRYLNQLKLDPTYTNAFGDTITVQQRQDIQLNKFFMPFSGWFLSPKFRYYLYVWSANTAQGDPAQVVGAGNIGWSFNRFVTLGGGITALPCVRSTEGQFPYWLGVDDRLTADEFFRGSYTTGVWIKGEIVTKLKYMTMVGNNLSQLGVSASQLDNELNTTSTMLQWLPTTGEFGLYGGFGDYDYHEKLATRFAAHFTHSREDAQMQPAADSIENSQIRLTDGSIIFTPDLFGPGISVNKVTYQMAATDAGFKYRGYSLDVEFYWRWLSNFTGPGTDVIEDINDNGFQVQSSAMAIPKVLQFYLSGSAIRGGPFGDGSELRVGMNWYPLKKRGLRANVEWIRLSNCPVGYTAVPYPVGGNGELYSINFEMNF